MAGAVTVVVILALAALAWWRGRKKGTCAVCSCGGCKHSGSHECHCNK